MCVGLMLITLFSCGGSQPDVEDKRDPSSSSAAIFDDIGREVLLTKAPKRIVSLAPNTTEILFALGAGNRVVGVTEYCNYPPAARDVKKVGSFSFLNIERILSVSPDLVIMSTLEQERFIKTLEDLEIPVYVCFPRNFNELFRSIQEIGKLTETSERASAIVDSLRIELSVLEDEADQAFGESGRPRVYLEISERPLMTVGEDSFLGELIDIAGGINIGHGIPRDYAVINPEIVISRNPDVIFIFQSSTTKENLVKRLGWNRVKAVWTEAIFDDLNEDIVFRPGPRSVQGAREIFERLQTVQKGKDNVVDKTQNR
jgi:iron complex transport system substrate-binding protein